MLVSLATKHLPSSHFGSDSVLECPAMPRLGAGSGAGDARDGRNAEDKKERGRRGRRREQCEEWALQRVQRVRSTMFGGAGDSWRGLRFRSGLARPWPQLPESPSSPYCCTHARQLTVQSYVDSTTESHGESTSSPPRPQATLLRLVTCARLLLLPIVPASTHSPQLLSTALQHSPWLFPAAKPRPRKFQTR
jgi:hypothetical protein